MTLVTVSGTLNLFLGLYVFFRRKQYSEISTYFLLGTAAKTIYCFGYTFSLTSSTLEQLRFWSVVQYIGMPFAPPLGLLFVLKYFGFKVKKGQIAALLAIPALSLLSNATNRFHHLHYKQYQVHPLLGAPYNDIEVGPTYIVMGAFIFLCFISSHLLLLSRWKDTDKAYRPQLLTLLGAHFIPMATSFLYLVGVTPAGIDPVPMVLGATSILMWWTIESSRLLTIIPIAKDAIFHSILSGVIVLDKRDRLVEYNDSCQKMFPKLDRSMFGQPLEKIWPAMFGPLSPLPLPGEQMQELEVVAREPDERICQVRISPLKKSGRSELRGTVMIITDITELKRMQRTLERHAYYDELTRILNRRAFMERCEENYARSRKEAADFTVILFDIDHFKQINDTYGHLAGDRVLVHIARICESSLTDEMLFARYGGEEFVLALYGRTAEEGRQFAEQLRVTIASQPVAMDGDLIRVTSSFGVAESSGRKEETLQKLLHYADKALYEAKRGGRNRVCVYRSR
jgi:diguanylate cyclase (GGDEF)-like protein